MDIFVVDDERMIAETLAIILRRAGYTACAFGNSLDALRALQAHHQQPRLLISDYDMPGVDGGTLIGFFSAAQPNAPSILLTGNPGCYAAVAGRPIVINKPLHPKDLLKAVGTLIGGPRCAAA